MNSGGMRQQQEMGGSPHACVLAQFANGTIMLIKSWVILQLNNPAGCEDQLMITYK